MKSKKVTIVDYGLGNLLSLKRAFEFHDASVIITKEHKVISNSSRVVLPGVGAFGTAMQFIKDLNIEESLISVAEKGIPFLGICLGMQLLFTESEEFKKTKGLNLMTGKVISIPTNSVNGKRLTLPHIGWNSIVPSNNLNNWKGTILEDNNFSDEVYFIHSLMAAPQNEEDKIAECIYGGHRIIAAVKKNNISGCQFHPEKSGELGLKILKNFIS
jgi:imidazole glycerol-phosphate synthase subunit HisH